MNWENSSKVAMENLLTQLHLTRRKSQDFESELKSVLDESVLGEGNLCISIHQKYQRQILIFLYELEHLIEMVGYTPKQLHLKTNVGKRDILTNYLKRTRFCFYLGIMSLFEDFVIILNKNLGSIDDQFMKKSLVSKYKLLCEQPDKNVTECIHGYSTIRNSLHNNGFYIKKTYYCKELNKLFEPGQRISFTHEELINYVSHIFSITHDLSKKYLQKNITDDTMF